MDLAAAIFAGDLGAAYLGTQGDVWDAQKDMLLAGFGAIVSVSCVLLLRGAPGIHGTSAFAKVRV